MSRLLVCSDIHGQYRDFIELLTISKYDKNQDQLVLLGDFVDRGPNTREVIEIVVELVENHNAIALMGNHDDWFIRGVLNEMDRDDEENWLVQGGQESVDSYEDQDEMKRHAQWMRANLKLFHETDHFIFVHAGVRPGIPLDKQAEIDLLWIRHNRPCKLGKLVIHGHTPVNEVALIHDQLFIDTGSVYGGKLTMVELPNGEIFEVRNKLKQAI